ncbi:MAG: tRNA-dihydrouridine synthase family protein [Bacilli bacterium]|nr:tRNA-dihydrouridine synthase family protein [Bacilli bacterium]MDY6430416.1 tRNA-dihydrouridine synthase family protein [Bacilli bacterium]
MKVKDLEIQGYCVLGPMAGVTSSSYRKFMKKFGVGLTFTEMISDCGIDYGNKRTFEYTNISKEERPIALQIFGSDIGKSCEAIKILEKTCEYDILDVNLGCPVHKVVKTGAGSAWLKDLDKLKNYMKAIIATSSKPVSAKIRLGWDANSINVEECALMLESIGVSLLSIHCRTKEQGYSGKANYETIRGLREKLNIPLIVSGDIFSLEDAIRAKEITHSDAIMIARGGIGHPFLIKQINTYFESNGTEILANPDLKTQISYAKEYANMLIEEKGEHVAIRELRSILPHFISSFPGYKSYRLRISQQMKSLSDLENILSELE